MMIMGCDFHTRYQQIAMMDGERYVNHSPTICYGRVLQRSEAGGSAEFPLAGGALFAFFFSAKGASL